MRIEDIIKGITYLVAAFALRHFGDESLWWTVTLGFYYLILKE
jgi:hypothetical protein